MTRKSWLAILLTLGLMASLVILGACGGGDNDDGADPTDTPVEDVIDDDPDDDDDAADDNDAAADDGDDGSADGSVADLGGEWVGVWNNDTFSTSAPITLSISIGDEGSAAITLGLSSTADSAPFGVPDVEPTMLEGTIEDGVLNVELVGHALFGDMTATILADGTLEVSATMDGAPGIAGMTVSGTFDGDGLDVTYTITFLDGSDATGTATLSRVGA